MIHRDVPGSKASPRLLSGGNPQIPKGDGAAVVEAWMNAAPTWKGTIARELDALVVASVPGLSKAVRWNSPFYGLPGHGWFLSMHCFERYVKVSFLRGNALDPLPPVPSKHAEVRYAHLSEGQPLDLACWTTWIRQAAALPGDPLF